MSALTDIWNTITGIIHTSDVIALVIMAVIAIAVAWFSQGMGSILTSVLIALVADGVVTVIRGIVQGGSKTDFGTLLSTDWHNAMIMPTQTLLAYAIIFGVVIGVVGAIKSVLGR
ncbi:MAG TPA: hypothetical protein VGF56_03200 [Rhizomicrobium sp.]|jgi:hypothetical protein